MKKRILAGLLAALLMAVCVLAIPAPAASAEEPETEETAAAISWLAEHLRISLPAKKV